MILSILKLIAAIFSPEFGVLIGQIRQQKIRETSREVEAAKEDAQVRHDTRKLQEKLGEFTE